MPNNTDNALVESLQAGIRQAQIERDTKIAEIASEYEARINRLLAALAALDGSEPRLAEDQAPVSLSVGEDKLAFIRDYVRRHSHARQADISRALQSAFGTTASSASGAVSVGVRRLQIAGEIAPGRKVRGSNTWNPVVQSSVVAYESAQEG